MSNSIKVVARFRPQNRTEIELGGQPIVTFEDEETCRLDVSMEIGSKRTATDFASSPRKLQGLLLSIVCLI